MKMVKPSSALKINLGGHKYEAGHVVKTVTT
jgi:hypothetical protein